MYLNKSFCTRGSRMITIMFITARLPYYQGCLKKVYN